MVVCFKNFNFYKYIYRLTASALRKSLPRSWSSSGRRLDFCHKQNKINAENYFITFTDQPVHLQEGDRPGLSHGRAISGLGEVGRTGNQFNLTNFLHIFFLKKIFPSQIFKLEEYKVALDMLKEGSISKAMFNVSTS